MWYSLHIKTNIFHLLFCVWYTPVSFLGLTAIIYQFPLIGRNLSEYFNTSKEAVCSFIPRVDFKGWGIYFTAIELYLNSLHLLKQLPLLLKGRIIHYLETKLAVGKFEIWVLDSCFDRTISIKLSYSCSPRLH